MPRRRLSRVTILLSPPAPGGLGSACVSPWPRRRPNLCAPHALRVTLPISSAAACAADECNQVLCTHPGRAVLAPEIEPASHSLQVLTLMEQRACSLMCL
ncbi:hypothetical protein NDU88_000585 [Pleurodeles waltl]|uniref:Secreted protein n=1 Tax=Pleurodeles waltl TaxID=8319 RepID=A0AAV7U5E1_PLEWA|nr:hypothetical protein NDU88_000585 [Pleurodeles waltl]